MIYPGSSPRMRGAPVPVAPQVPDAGIIPAYAGSTPFDGQHMPAHRDHPRVCGEHHLASRAFSRKCGSSPRMRGAPGPWPWTIIRRRIIPAYAGSTDRLHDSLTVKADHPRVCGEHCEILGYSSIEQGSSPRMRGAPFAWAAMRPHGGIIPAYAGSTTPYSCLTET